ncbi:uncharacterized protein ARMOST_15215 [Armillaria ostoyae]|uniref:Uncharacterized protein n=1 Tax=Armillaria ostoyae TaxID=47428 RepID=A0A284RSY1_ARMOS|nr:uncharacterized protein ARMOST_15215 [Armillaria ostoyae]
MEGRPRFGTLFYTNYVTQINSHMLICCLCVHT